MLAIQTQDGEEQVIYVSGGILEVTPKIVTVLSDTAMRADDIDEAAALEAQAKAEQALQDTQADINYAKAKAELLKGQLKDQNLDDLAKKSEALIKKINAIEEAYNGPKDVQGLYRDPNLLNAKLSAASRSLQDVIYPVSETNKLLVDRFEKEMIATLKKMDQLLSKDWAAYKREVKSSKFELLPD